MTVDWSLTIGGNSVTDILDVSFNRRMNNKLNEALIVVANTPSNRQFDRATGTTGSGEEVILKKDGNKEFTGYLTGEPTKAGTNQTELEIKAVDKRSALKYEYSDRVFKETDSGTVVKNIIDKESDFRFNDFLFKGNTIGDWTSDNVDEFLQGDTPSAGLSNVGGDYIFVGWASGRGGFDTTSYVRNTNVGTIDNLDSIETRFLLNNAGSNIEMEVAVADTNGNEYYWEVFPRFSEFQSEELKAEEASDETHLNDHFSISGTDVIEYRFEFNGKIPEPRACAIDFAKQFKVSLSNRNTGLSTTEVNTTGRNITRRFNQNVLESIHQIAVEDGMVHYVDTKDNFNFKQRGSESSGKSISDGTTNVVDANFFRDYENIKNKVVVKGAGEVKAVVEDSASINYYGVSARAEPIIDRTLQTRSEAVERGRGFLQKNAWNDILMEFTIMNDSFLDVQPGQLIDVTWNPENIDGKYIINSIKSDKYGIVTLGLGSRHGS